MASKKQPASVEDYLESLPEDRRTAIEAVRKVILKNLDKDYEEGILYGMICYFVPHSVFPAGYHCDPSKPLFFAGLASQKSGMSLHLMCAYMDMGEGERFRAAWKKSGKKLDMGKACVRFKKLGDVPLDVIGDTIKRHPVTKWLKCYEGALEKMGKGKAKPAAKKAKAKSR